MISKIMFLNAVNVSKEVETLIPPLGLGYLASSLRKEFGSNRFEFKVIDRDVERQIEVFQPDLVGITAVSQNYNKAIQYAGIAKRQGLPVIVGGVHISALPGTLSPDMDVGVIGEGERTIVDLMRLLDRKGSFDAASLAELPGVVFRENGKIVLTPKDGPIEPLDSLPAPARDLWGIQRSTSMLTSRGCPYRCRFCASCRFWGKVRFFSAEYVVNEIHHLVDQYGVEKVSFWDDLFVADRARLERIGELLRKDQILKRVRFSCHVRSNLVTEELALLLREMNIRSVGMGLESGSPATLEYLKGRNVCVQDHVNAIHVLRKHGIKFHTSFIIGSPQETREDILQTLSFIQENRLESFDINVLTPFPGTPIWDDARARNLVDEDMDWDRLNVHFGVNHEDAVILSEKLTRAEIYELFLRFARVKKRMRIRKALKDPKSLWKLVREVLSGKLLVER
jgi:anaerobic magnesium-protoporphyrin IX monomethyl ester cyclase